MHGQQNVKKKKKYRTCVRRWILVNNFAWADLCKEKPDLKGTQHRTLSRTFQLFIYDLTNEYSYRTHFCT